MTFEDKCKRLSRPSAEKVGISTPNCLIVRFLLMLDKRESGDEGGKKREREAVAEGPGKRVRLKRELKEEPKEAKDPKVKVEDEEIASSSALSAPAPAPARPLQHPPRFHLHHPPLSQPSLWTSSPRTCTTLRRDVRRETYRC